MNKIKIISDMARHVSGDVHPGSDKERYKKLAFSFLRALAKKLALQKGDYDIRFNAGGPAVSGEATLHHKKFYLQFSWSGCMFRTCQHQKDYTGGPNQWAYGFGHSLSEDELAARLRAMLD
jgi:hypothetical protein